MAKFNLKFYSVMSEEFIHKFKSLNYRMPSFNNTLNYSSNFLNDRSPSTFMGVELYELGLVSTDFFQLYDDLSKTKNNVYYYCTSNSNDNKMYTIGEGDHLLIKEVNPIKQISSFIGRYDYGHYVPYNKNIEEMHLFMSFKDFDKFNNCVTENKGVAYSTDELYYYNTVIDIRIEDLEMLDTFFPECKINLYVDVREKILFNYGEYLEILKKIKQDYHIADNYF